MFPSPQPSPQRGEGADRANFSWGSLSPHRVRMFPLTPALSPKRRGGRPCQFFVGLPKPTGRSHVPLTPALSPKRRGGRPCQFFVGHPKPTGSPHVSPHPNPLPKEERGLTVPIFFVGNPQGEGTNIKNGNPGCRFAFASVTRLRAHSDAISPPLPPFAPLPPLSAASGFASGR